MVEATQRGIAKALRQWKKLRDERGRIEARRDQQLAEIRTRFEQRCAPIHNAAAEELAPVQSQIAALEEQITAAMMAGILQNGDVRITRVPIATAVVEVVTTCEREIDTRKFFEAVPPSERGDAFWSCLKTYVGKAERLLGSRVNDLAHAKRRHSVVFSEVGGRG